MITFRLNTREFHDTGVELRRWKKMDVPQFVRYRARVVTQDLGKWTPPRGPHPGSEGWPSMKKRGEKNVERDIRKVYKAIDQLGIWKAPTNPKLSAWLKRMVRSGNIPAIKAVFDQLGIRYASIFPIPYGSIHETARTTRGRVGGSKDRSNFVFYESDIKKYITLRQKEVGLLKSGWGMAALRLGAKLPVWVTKHGANGQFQDKLSIPDRPTVVLVNDTKAAKDMDQEELVDAVLFINELKLQKELKAILAYQCRKHSAH